MHDVRSKSPPWGYASRSNSRGLPDPPPLGLTLIGALGPSLQMEHRWLRTPHQWTWSSTFHSASFQLHPISFSSHQCPVVSCFRGYSLPLGIFSVHPFNRVLKWWRRKIFFWNYGIWCHILIEEKMPSSQKLALNCNSQWRHKGLKFDSIPYKPFKICFSSFSLEPTQNWRDLYGAI